MTEMVVFYTLSVLLFLTITYLVFVLAKVHANARVIDSPDSIIKELRGLRSAFGTLDKSIKSGHQETVRSVIKLQDDAFQRLVNDSLKRSESNALVQDHLVRILGRQGERFSEIEAILDALRNQSSNADDQLRRFQEGYHWTINKSLILGILRVLDEVYELIEEARAPEDGKASEALELVREHLEVLLENEGVVVYEPPIGESYAQHRAMAKAVSDPTDDRAKNNTIARIIRPGYVSDTGAAPPPLIRPAQVAVFQYQEVAPGSSQ